MTEEHIRLNILAQRLASGNATQQERDELLSMMAIAIAGVLNLDDSLDRRIRDIHNKLCIDCDIRKRLEKIESDGNGWLSKFTNVKLPWVIVAILSAVIASLLGIDISSFVKH